jgi:hypothetical protein
MRVDDTHVISQKQDLGSVMVAKLQSVSEGQATRAIGRIQHARTDIQAAWESIWSS